MKTKTLLLTLPAVLLVACGSEDKTSPAEEKGSSGSTSESSSAEIGNLEAKVKDVLKPEIAQFSTKLLMQTPPYLEVEGPVYATKIKEDAGITLTDLTWQWTSKEDLYSQEDSLETEAGEVKVIKKTKSKGEVAEHLAKAVCNLSKEGEVKFQRVSSSDYSFHVSEAGFADLGQPRSRFGNAVELGSDEYLKAVKKAKAFKDMKAEKLRLAVEKAEADRKAKLQAKANSFLSAYKKGDVFSGKLKARNYDREQSASITLKVNTFEEKAGKYISNITLTHSYWSNGKEVKANAIFDGEYNDKGIMSFTMTKKWPRSGSVVWGLVNRRDVSFEFIPTEHKDRFSVKCAYSSWKITGDLIRQ